MKKLLAAVVAGLFALSTAPAVLAAKHEMKKEEMKKEMKKEGMKKEGKKVMKKGEGKKKMKEEMKK